MAFQTSSLILATLGAATLLLLPACDPAVGSTDTDGTTGGTTTDSTSGPSTTSTTDPESTSSTSTTGPGTSTSTTTTSTGSESSSSTGEPEDCVDADIGDAVGPEVASGSNDGQGDDFTLRFCDGGVSSSSTSDSTTGPDDTGGGAEATTDPTGATTGFGSTTGGFGESGDDYVVSWTPPSSGPFVLDTFGSGIDTVLSVVAPQCGAAGRDCNDDCDGLESGIVYEATEGETVYIVIEGYSGRQGTFVLNIAQGDELECGGFGTSSGGFETDGGMTTSAGTSPGTSP